MQLVENSVWNLDINGKSVQLYVPDYFINTRRRSKNPFYNFNKGTIYNEISRYLMQKLPADMMQALKEYYERPFYEKDEWWG